LGVTTRTAQPGATRTRGRRMAVPSGTPWPRGPWSRQPKSGHGRVTARAVARPPPRRPVAGAAGAALPKRAAHRRPRTVAP